MGLVERVPSYPEEKGGVGGYFLILAYAYVRPQKGVVFKLFGQKQGTNFGHFVYQYKHCL